MKKNERNKRGGRRPGCGGGGASVEVEVERLGQRFEMFRRSYEPGTRVPDELRAAALSALDRGASEGDLRRSCQVTTAQLRLWREQLRRRAQVGGPAEPDARVFEVVDEPPELDTRPGSDARTPELELRLGRWAVRISQLGG